MSGPKYSAQYRFHLGRLLRIAGGGGLTQSSTLVATRFRHCPLPAPSTPGSDWVRRAAGSRLTRARCCWERRVSTGTHANHTLRGCSATLGCPSVRHLLTSPLPPPPQATKRVCIRCFFLRLRVYVSASPPPKLSPPATSSSPFVLVNLSTPRSCFVTPQCPTGESGRYQ